MSILSIFCVSACAHVKLYIIREKDALSKVQFSLIYWKVMKEQKKPFMISKIQNIDRYFLAETRGSYHNEYSAAFNLVHIMHVNGRMWINWRILLSFIWYDYNISKSLKFCHYFLHENSNSRKMFCVNCKFNASKLNHSSSSTYMKTIFRLLWEIFHWNQFSWDFHKKYWFQENVHS